MQYPVKVIYLIVAATLFSFVAPDDFLTEQKKFSRVKTALKEKGKNVEEKLAENNIALNELNILLVAFKEEQQLEVYAKKKQETVYRKLITYNICSGSGNPGPKRKMGDNQVPEGFYYIDRFNPSSNFYLSLGINYPNQSDRKKSTAKNPGGDIFIHGSCVTIGCIPITDDKIKEVYLYAIHAKQNGQNKIPVYIFPYKMTEQNFNKHKSVHKSNKELTCFWSNLKTGYDQFEKERKVIKYAFDKEGNYAY